MWQLRGLHWPVVPVGVYQAVAGHYLVAEGSNAFCQGLL